MHVRSMLLVMGVFACASSGPSTPSGSQGNVSIAAAGGRTTLSTSSDPVPGVATVAAPIDAIWRALPAVFDSLAIPLTTIDAASHTIGNVGMQLRRELGKVRLSRYIDCGSPQARPSADFYDVSLSVITRLQSEASGDTRVSTTVDAMAKPVSFTGEYVRCASTGGIESKVRALLDAELKRRAK